LMVTSYDSITSWIAAPMSLRRTSIPASCDMDTQMYTHWLTIGSNSSREGVI
jgi:hypothetical protein